MIVDQLCFAQILVDDVKYLLGAAGVVGGVVMTITRADKDAYVRTLARGFTSAFGYAIVSLVKLKWWGREIICPLVNEVTTTHCGRPKLWMLR